MDRKPLIGVVQQSPVDFDCKVSANPLQVFLQQRSHDFSPVSPALTSVELQGFSVTSLGQNDAGHDVELAIRIMRHPLQILRIPDSLLFSPSRGLPCTRLFYKGCRTLVLKLCAGAPTEHSARRKITAVFMRSPRNAQFLAPSIFRE